MIALANSPVVVIVGAVLNCLGTGMLLPSLLISPHRAAEHRWRSSASTSSSNNVRSNVRVRAVLRCIHPRRERRGFCKSPGKTSGAQRLAHPDRVMAVRSPLDRLAPSGEG
ncbi:hypothetical protein [Streptomyces europaeiscabiei]|uniref:hypothetical protein n=1 Tax=Streptomyces europaeiscabiei TaxID=146819 RepID=UPI002E2E7C18|nr:hypothetical protein [Streptomyces europaeiscabiei]